MGLPFANALPLCAEAEKRLADFPHSSYTKLMLPCQSATLFLFSDWYASTGLLLAVRIQTEYTTAKKILDNLTRPRFFEEDPTQKAQDRVSEKEAEAVEELLYYTDRIFAEDSDATPMMQTHLLANFAGCRLDQLDLNAAFPFPDKMVKDRYSAFLLCIFLTLRKTGGTVSAKENQQNVGKVQEEITAGSHAELAFSITQKELSREKTDFDLPIHRSKAPRFLFPFMELPCFRSFKLEQSDGALRFEMTARHQEYALFTAGFEAIPFTFRFILRPIPSAV